MSTNLRIVVSQGLMFVDFQPTYAYFEDFVAEVSLITSNINFRRSVVVLRPLMPNVVVSKVMYIVVLNNCHEWGIFFTCINNVAHQTCNTLHIFSFESIFK